MKTGFHVFDVRKSNRDTVFDGNIQRFVAKTVYIVIMGMRILNRTWCTSCDPVLILHQIGFFSNFPDRTAGRHGLRLLAGAAAFDIDIFPGAVTQFSYVGLRDLAFFHDDVPVGAIFAAEDMIDVAAVRLIELKTVVFFYKTDESILRNR